MLFESVLLQKVDEKNAFDSHTFFYFSRKTQWNNNFTLMPVFFLVSIFLSLGSVVVLNGIPSSCWFCATQATRIVGGLGWGGWGGEG